MKKIAFVALMACATLASTSQTLRLGTTGKTLGIENITSETKAITINRMLFAGYNTICLPFSVSAEQLQFLGLQAEKMVATEGNEITFMDCTADGMEAGMPYLIYSEARTVKTFKCNDTNNIASAPKTITINGITMKGEWSQCSQTGYYGIPAQQDSDLLQSILENTNGTKVFMPTRCSFSNKSNITPTIKHVTTMEGTSIQQLVQSNATVDVYTSTGTLVKKSININTAMNTLPSGVYVARGQKFIVK